MVTIQEVMMFGEQAPFQSFGEKEIKFKGDRRKKAFYGGDKLIIYFINLRREFF